MLYHQSHEGTQVFTLAEMLVLFFLAAGFQNHSSEEQAYRSSESVPSFGTGNKNSSSEMYAGNVIVKNEIEGVYGVCIWLSCCLFDLCH